MATPKYRWICKRCGAGNDAGLDVCNACGCKAAVSAEEIDPAPVSTSEPIDWWLFIPEAPIAGILVLITPIWAAKLAFQGHVVVAAALLCGVAFFGYLCYLGLRNGRQWLMYFAILGIIITGGMSM